jgi:hypothetical protein
MAFMKRILRALAQSHPELTTSSRAVEETLVNERRRHQIYTPWLMVHNVMSGTPWLRPTPLSVQFIRVNFDTRLGSLLPITSIRIKRPHQVLRGPSGSSDRTKSCVVNFRCLDRTPRSKSSPALHSWAASTHEVIYRGCCLIIRATGGTSYFQVSNSMMASKKINCGSTTVP